jgi:hypothetical protein
MKMPKQPSRLVVGLACLLVLSRAAAGQSVTTKDGNIYFKPSGTGELSKLTSTGLDREPNLSADGRLVVFVRQTPGRLVEGPVDETEETELWTVRTDGKDPRLLVRGGVARLPDGFPPMGSFRYPQFSPDGKWIYFLSICAVTSDVAYAVDVKSGELRSVCPANSLIVVRKGEYAGDLIVEQHRYFMGGGSYDWVFVVAPDGKELGTLGDRHAPGFDERLKDVLGGDDP